MKEKLRIFAAADLHGNLELAKKLAKKAREESADIVLLAGDISGVEESKGEILEPFLEEGHKVFFVPGNWDSSQEVYIFSKKAKNLHDYYVTYGEVSIHGIGNSDWKMELTKKDLESILDSLSKSKAKKKILVSHLHAKDLRFEKMGFYGDEILRIAVEKASPDILISAHIHEIEGLEDKIGKTKVFQVGRKGKIIKI